MVLPFWYRLTWVVPDKGPLNVCVCVCVAISVERVSGSAVLQLYLFVGHMTHDDFLQFTDPRRVARKTPIIFAGFVNVTLFHGNASGAFDALARANYNLFQPVWLYNFTFVTRGAARIL